MTENERCPECGSWGEECAFPSAQANCGCARCLRAQRDEARAEAAHFKEIARQRAEDFLAANAERVKAVERANNPSAEVPCTYCGIKFKAEEFHCGDCMEELDDAVLVETVRDVAERQREADLSIVWNWLRDRVSSDVADEIPTLPLVTEEN